MLAYIQYVVGISRFVLQCVVSRNHALTPQTILSMLLSMLGDRPPPHPMLRRMQHLNIRPVDLADHLEVGRSAVSEWLSGHCVPGLHRWREIAEALQVELITIFDWFVPE